MAFRVTAAPFAAEATWAPVVGPTEAFVDPRLHAEFVDARGGDPRAFRALIEGLAPGLVRFTSFLLDGDRDGAQDVVQVVLVEAWKQLPRLETAEHLRRWCYRVARCRAISWKRRHGMRWRRLQQLSTIEDISALTPWRSQRPSSAEHVRERASAFKALHHALLHLPHGYGAPVQLHYLQGYGLRETADLLGLSVASVKMRLVRARARLRLSLGELSQRETAPRPHPVHTRGQGGPHAR